MTARRIAAAGMVILAALTLAACHKRASDDVEAASSRGLQVEAYDPVIPKAPAKGKLETLAAHSEDRAPAAPASSAPAAGDSSQPSEAKE